MRDECGDLDKGKGCRRLWRVMTIIRRTMSRGVSRLLMMMTNTFCRLLMTMTRILWRGGLMMSSVLMLRLNLEQQRQVLSEIVGYYLLLNNSKQVCDRIDVEQDMRYGDEID